MHPFRTFPRSAAFVRSTARISPVDTRFHERRLVAVFLTLCTVIGILVTCATAAAAEIAKCASANTAPTTITVDNQSSAAITLYWLNDECEEVTYRALQPGAVV